MVYGHSRLTWYLAVFAGVGNDILDYFGGSMPIAGDVLDLLSSAILYPVVGPFLDFLTLAELIPGVDFFPVHSSALFLAYITGRR